MGCGGCWALVAASQGRHKRLVPWEVDSRTKSLHEARFPPWWAPTGLPAPSQEHRDWGQEAPQVPALWFHRSQVGAGVLLWDLWGRCSQEKLEGQEGNSGTGAAAAEDGPRPLGLDPWEARSTWGRFYPRQNRAWTPMPAAPGIGQACSRRVWVAAVAGPASWGEVSADEGSVVAKGPF